MPHHPCCPHHDSATTRLPCQCSRYDDDDHAFASLREARRIEEMQAAEREDHGDRSDQL